MDNWFSKATNVFRRESAEQPQPFQTVCECGQSHMGIRRKTHQHIVCKACGTSLFVLPTDVYPASKQSRRSAVQPDAEPEVEPESEIESDDSDIAIAPDPDEYLPEHRPTIAERPPGMDAPDMPLPVPPVPRRKRPPKEKPKKPAKTAKVPATPRLPAVPLTTMLGSFLAGVFTPLRLVLLGLAGLSVLMGFLIVSQQRQKSALRTIQTEVEAGRVAVAEESWLEARDHLGAAVAAFDVLERTDPEANEVRQLHRESQALTRLSAGSFLDLVEEAEEQLRTQDPLQLTSVLQGKHGLDWYVLEGPVRQRTLDAERDQNLKVGYELVLPWVVSGSGRRIRVEADFACFGKMVTGREPVNLLFAGQLAECRLEGEVWVIRLEPSNGFLWANRLTYDALRFPEDPQRPLDQLEAFLKPQAQAMGVEL